MAEDHTITVTFKLTIDLTDPKTWPRNGSTIIAPEGIELNAELADKMLAVEGVDSIDLSKSGIEEIPDRAFYNQNDLVSITVPDGTAIGKYAFDSCPSLKTVSGTLGNVDKYAFYNCGALTGVTINGSVGDQAFGSCSELQNLWLGENFSIVEGADPFSGAFSSVSDLHVHHYGPENEDVKNIFKIFEDTSKNVIYHWDCNGKDRGPNTAVNSSFARFLPGL